MNIAEAVYEMYPNKKQKELIDEGRVCRITATGKDDDGKPIDLVYLVTGDGSLLDFDWPEGLPLILVQLQKWGKLLSEWRVIPSPDPTPGEMMGLVLSDWRMEI